MIKNNFILVDENTKDLIYKEYNTNSEQAKKDVQLLQEWAKREPHLPNTILDDFLLNYLIRNKFSLEKTKKSLERYYTLKAINAGRMIEIRSALPLQIKPWIIVLPTLTDKLERIVIIKVKDEGIPNEEEFLQGFKYMLCLIEYSLRTDFSLKHRFIQDFEEMKEGTVKKLTNGVNPRTMQIVKPYLETNFGRIAGIEYLNVSPFIEKCINAVKKMVSCTSMSAKILKRISFHKDLTSLHKNVNKAYLPPEYGGNLKNTIPEFLGMLHTEIENNIDVLEQIVSGEIADESKRIGGSKPSEMFGLNGTFKELLID